MYWLLMSHILALVPCVVCFNTYWKTKNYQAAYTGLQIGFTAIFSVFYHTYDYDNIDVDVVLHTYDSWALLDHWASPSVILTTILYVIRFRTEVFYCLSYLCSVTFLVGTLAHSVFMEFVVLFSAGFFILIKYRSVLRYLRNFPRLSASGLLVLATAIFCYYYASIGDFQLWHSLWHFCIFASAGIFCRMREKIDRILNIPGETYQRTTTESI